MAKRSTKSPEWDRAYRSAAPADAAQKTFVSWLAQDIHRRERDKIDQRVKEMRRLVRVAPLPETRRLYDRLSDKKDPLAKLTKLELSGEFAQSLRFDLASRLRGHHPITDEQRGTTADARHTGGPRRSTRASVAAATTTVVSPLKTTVSGTSPPERGITRVSTTPDLDMDSLDLGGDWDEYGNYWYADSEGWNWVWSESAQQWQLLSTPDQAIEVWGRAPLTDEDRAWMNSVDAYKRHLQAPGRQFGRTLMGGPPRIVGKMIAEVGSNEYVNLGVLDPTGGMVSGFLGNKADEFKQVEAEIIADTQRRDAESEARTAHAHGELYQIPVVVASDDKLEKEHQAAIAAGTIKTVGSAVRAPARVEGLINDITQVFRDELVAAKLDEPNATASRHGTRAEQRTLAKVPALARARGLNPGHIMLNNFPVGVTGPRGGQLSAEMGSPHYGFMIELKKSPKAVKGWQARGHLIAVDYSLNFPRGGVYVRIYGENYKPNAGVDRRAMGGALKPPRPPRTRIR